MMPRISPDRTDQLTSRSATSAPYCTRQLLDSQDFFLAAGDVVVPTFSTRPNQIFVLI